MPGQSGILVFIYLGACTGYKIHTMSVIYLFQSTFLHALHQQGIISIAFGKSKDVFICYFPTEQRGICLYSDFEQ